MVLVVVGSVLWYIHEQMKQLLVDVLDKFLIGQYSSEAIEEAKNIIFEKFPEE